MLERLRRYRLALIQHLDMAKAERAGVFEFPEEFEALEGPLCAYLCSMFPDSKLLEPLYLQGFYITSAMQSSPKSHLPRAA